MLITHTNATFNYYYEIITYGVLPNEFNFCNNYNDYLHPFGFFYYIKTHPLTVLFKLEQ